MTIAYTLVTYTVTKSITSSLRLSSESWAWLFNELCDPGHLSTSVSSLVKWKSHYLTLRWLKIEEKTDTYIYILNTYTCM